MMKTRTALCTALMTALACHAAEGQLDPPAGPIAPTMKPLDAIEPRVCVNELPGAPDAVHHITEPGNYYLTADIVGEPMKHGVLIDPSADGAYTLDLNGFSLIGVPGSLDGVHGNDLGGHKDWINIMSFKHAGGSIADWDGDGIHTENFDFVNLSNVQIDNCGADGVTVADAIRVVFVEGSVSNSVDDGVTIVDALALELIELSADNNGGDGVDVSFAPGEPVSGINVSLEQVAASNNNGHGVHVSMTPGEPVSGINVSLEQITGSTNGGDGIHVFTSPDPGAAVGPVTVTLTHCDAFGNSIAGVHIENGGADKIDAILSEVVCAGNVGDGHVLLDARGSMDACTSRDNGGAGVRVLNSAPAQEQFANLIDSFIHRCDDGVVATDVDLTVRRCSVTHNFGDGVRATSTTSDRKDMLQWWCDVSHNGGSGVTTTDLTNVEVRDSTASNNMSYGFNFEQQTAAGSVTMRGCAANDNFDGGIRTTSTKNIVFETCVSNNNDGNGITIEDLTLQPLGGEVSVHGCTSTGNNGAGIASTTTGGIACGTFSITDCVTNRNSTDGVKLACTTGGMIRACEASNNGGVGFVVGGSGHVVIENTASANALGGYSVPLPGNSVGPIVDELGMATNTNPSANYVR